MKIVLFATLLIIVIVAYDSDFGIFFDNPVYLSEFCDINNTDPSKYLYFQGWVAVTTTASLFMTSGAGASGYGKYNADGLSATGGSGGSGCSGAQLQVSLENVGPDNQSVLWFNGLLAKQNSPGIGYTSMICFRSALTSFLVFGGDQAETNATLGGLNVGSGGRGCHTTANIEHETSLPTATTGVMITGFWITPPFQGQDGDDGNYNGQTIAGAVGSGGVSSSGRGGCGTVSPSLVNLPASSDGGHIWAKLESIKNR